MTEDDIRTILFEIGCIWGTLATMKVRSEMVSTALDSCEVIKGIVEKYGDENEKEDEG